MDSIVRLSPNDAMRFANAFVDISGTAGAHRLSIRGTTRGCREFVKPLGLTLPTKPGATSQSDGRLLVWLGPDEWLFVDHQEGDDIYVDLPSGEKGCAVTDVSHRNTGFLVSGTGAAATLNSSSPRDLSVPKFPIGTGSRTLLGKAEIVLVRLEETVFRVECWRSYAPYVFELLQQGAGNSQL